MVHICNECEYRGDCKEFLKDEAGILCNNKLYQQEREKEWARMIDKEIEEDNILKISVPFITNAELNAIDNNLDSFISQFIKQLVHDKELFIAQHIIKKQKERIDQLESKIKEVTDILKKEKSEIEYTGSQINGNYYMTQDELNLINEVLRILEK